MNKPEIKWLTGEDIADRCFHNGVKQSIADARAKGLSETILTTARERHIDACKRRGIPVAHVKW